MKKIWTILILLALLCSAWTAGNAEETPDLLDVYLAAEDGDRWIASAAPVYTGVALTVPFGETEDVSRIYLSDGKRRWNAEVILPASEGSLSVIFFGENEEEKPAVYPLEDPGSVLSPVDCVVRAGDDRGSRSDREITEAVLVSWKGMEAWLLTLSGDTRPGAAMVTGDGRLAGIVAAEYAEGINRYIALTSVGLYNGVLEAASVLEILEFDNPAEGYSVSVNENEVTFDWSGMALPEVPEGQTLYLVVADSMSDYLTYYAPMPDETSTVMLLTPGRIYISGLMVSASVPQELPEYTALTVLPQAEFLTDYGFRSDICAIAEIPEAGLKEGEMPAPAGEVTEELLRSGRACFYSVTAYEVDQRLENVSLLVTLTDPNGSNYRYASYWVYDPGCMDHDEWYMPLGETGLLDMLNTSGYPDGRYQVSMYIGGKLADFFDFVLK